MSKWTVVEGPAFNLSHPSWLKLFAYIKKMDGGKYAVEWSSGWTIQGIDDEP